MFSGLFPMKIECLSPCILTKTLRFTLSNRHIPEQTNWPEDCDGLMASSPPESTS
eukprot:bmy_09232T0